MMTMNKEKIIEAALRLDEWERKQIALVLITSTLNKSAVTEAIHGPYDDLEFLMNARHAARDARR